jgi:multidrug efflux pump subunit AcrA (membrane-fusion protein)
MARLTPLHFVPALLAAASHAGEITIHPQLFFVSHQLAATAVPLEPILISPDGKLWENFEIAEIAPHGSHVAAGDLLVRFDPAAIDRKIAETKHARDAALLAVAEADLALKHLNETGPLRQAVLSLAARQAKEDNDYFTKTGRKAAEDRASQSLNVANHFLAQQREELTRLSKIHEPEKLPEQPEHIQISRQRDTVATAEFAFRMETLDHEHTLTVLIPREGEMLANRERETALALRQAEEDLHQQLEIKKFELASAKTAADLAAADLAALNADRALFEVKAPAPGCLFHGDLTENPASGKITVATFVPAGSKIGLVAHVSEAAAHSLTKDLEGTALVPGHAESAIPLKISGIAESPSSDGTYRVEISATWPQSGDPPVPGSALDVKFVSQQKQSTIAVPNKALAFGPAGWTVDVKLADGKTEPRPVKPGLVSDTTTEILSGLEPGQVIVVP